MRPVVIACLLLVLAGCQYNPAEDAGYALAGPGRSYQPPPPPPVGPPVR